MKYQTPNPLLKSNRSRKYEDTPRFFVPVDTNSIKLCDLLVNHVRQAYVVLPRMSNLHYDDDDVPIDCLPFLNLSLPNLLFETPTTKLLVTPLLL